MTDQGWSITLHCSWTGLILNSLGGIFLLAVATFVAVANGLSWFPVVLLVVAIVVAVGLAFDMPIATTFDDHGMVRRTALRRHRLLWGQVSRIRRGRAGISRGRKPNTGGGLIAWVGKKPYVLTDKMESTIEFDRLRQHLGHERADLLGVGTALRPVRERAPTWTYRGKKWKQGSSG